MMMREAKKLKQGYNRFVVYVPQKETSNFQMMASAMGVEVEAKNALDRALEDIMAGRVYSVDNVDELRKRFS